MMMIINDNEHLQSGIVGKEMKQRSNEEEGIIP
jgi:hypothetical protein